MTSSKTRVLHFKFFFFNILSPLLAAINTFSPHAKVLSKAPIKVMREQRSSPARLPIISDSGPITILRLSQLRKPNLTGKHGRQKRVGWNVCTASTQLPTSMCRYWKYPVNIYYNDKILYISTCPMQVSQVHLHFDFSTSNRKTSWTIPFKSLSAQKW